MDVGRESLKWQLLQKALVESTIQGWPLSKSQLSGNYCQKPLLGAVSKLFGSSFFGLRRLLAHERGVLYCCIAAWRGVLVHSRASSVWRGSCVCDHTIGLLVRWRSVAT